MTYPTDKEAAETLARIDQLSEDLKENFKKMNTILDHLELDGTEDTTALKANIKLFKELVAKNEATGALMRDTAE